jgi:hypothetical protein
VLDRVRNRLVTHGGVRGIDRLGDVWATPLAGAASWDSLETSGTPPAPRGDHVAVYDPVRDRMLVHGGRAANPNAPFGDLWALTWGVNTPTLVSLVEQQVTAEEVRLVWYSGDRAGEWTLERQEPAASWRNIGTLTPDGAGHVEYVDRAVRPRQRYGYRLKEAASGEVASELWVDVPERSGFSLHRAWYASRRLWLDVSRATGDDRARVEIVDASGRRVLSRSLAFGGSRQKLSVPFDAPSGIYFARVTQGARSASARVVVLD